MPVSLLSQVPAADAVALLLVGPHPLDLPGFRLTRVEPAALEPQRCAEVRAVLVDAADPAQAAAVCRRIRRHPQAAVYLAPILLLEPVAGGTPRALAGMADGVATPAAFPALYYQQFAEGVAAIHQRLAQLGNAGQGQDTNLAFKFLRHLYTRSGRIAPVHDADSPRGYHYPQLDAYLGGADENVFEILAFLEAQRLLAGSFVDKVHLCGSCHSAFLNFRETCPHCHSANLRVDDLVHHFRCAHVAPFAEYQRDGRLVCPKCRHELKQIGVDYDQPSAVSICQDCGHTSQEPETDTLCYRCGAVAAPEHLERLTVKAYALTGLAENAAIHGLDNLFRSILESELDMLPLPVFKRFLAVEVERVKRYRVSHSSLVMLFIEDLDRIYLRAGPRAKDIFGEFGRIVRAALRTSDVITSFNESLFLILATETPAEGAEGMAARLNERLDQLICSNFDQPARIVSRFRELDGGASADALIDALVNQGGQ